MPAPPLLDLSTLDHKKSSSQSTLHTFHLIQTVPDIKHCDGQLSADTSFVQSERRSSYHQTTYNKSCDVPTALGTSPRCRLDSQRFMCFAAKKPPPTIKDLLQSSEFNVDALSYIIFKCKYTDEKTRQQRHCGP